MAKTTSLHSAVEEQNALVKKLRREGKPLKPGTARVASVGLSAVIVDEDGRLPTKAREEYVLMELYALHAETQDDRYLNAARALVARESNRPSEDDDLAVRRMDKLIRGGWAVDDIHAARIIANELPSHLRPSCCKRLIRKYRRKFGRKSDT